MPYNINDYKPFREGNHSAFPSSENGCRHVGNNTKRQYVRHFKVDGEVFRAQERNGAIIFFSMMKQQPLITSN